MRGVARFVRCGSAWFGGLWSGATVWVMFGYCAAGQVWLGRVGHGVVRYRWVRQAWYVLLRHDVVGCGVFGAALGR